MCLNNSNSIVSCVKVWGKYQKSIEKRFWLLKTCTPGILWSSSFAHKVQFSYIRCSDLQCVGGLYRLYAKVRILRLLFIRTMEI